MSNITYSLLFLFTSPLLRRRLLLCLARRHGTGCLLALGPCCGLPDLPSKALHKAGSAISPPPGSRTALDVSECRQSLPVGKRQSRTIWSILPRGRLSNQNEVNLRSFCLPVRHVEHSGASLKLFSERRRTHLYRSIQGNPCAGNGRFFQQVIPTAGCYSS